MQNSYTLGPPLAAESTKPPWRPNTVGRVAFFLGPVAGALLVVMSLRRAGHAQAATKVIRLSLAFASIAGGILFFLPDAYARMVGLCTEILGLLFFPAAMKKEFNEWQTAHPTRTPANGWLAVGWGLLGTVMLVAFLFVLFIGLELLFPGR